MTTAEEQAHRLQLAKWCGWHNIPAPSGPIVDAFVKAMGANQYGVEETWDAFVWFCNGWDASAERCAALVEGRTGKGAYAQSTGAYRILTSAADEIRATVLHCRT